MTEQSGDGSLNKRPTFGQWLKISWPDLLTYLVMGAIGLTVFNLPPAQTRRFRVYTFDGSISSPEIAYPYEKAHIPTWLSALLSLTVPTIVFLLLQIRVRSFWDFNNAIFGMLYALLTAAVFQVILKWIIGGLRPHFLAVCQPDIPRIISGSQLGTGYDGMYYEASICTGDRARIKEALQSFPSGHTAAAFSTGLFTTLYLNAKLKLWANCRPVYWKLIVALLPLLGGVLIGGQLIIDGYHHWYDVIAGAGIGIVTGIGAYRTVYAGVWDWRCNHIPLVRSCPYEHAHLQGASATRKASWRGAAATESNAT
ncbi:hypothetical protein BAUCODRAFT_151731 [Baudoinia panamericana UAMH 10762]|uniref:Phosphatidic acid phosphatase type 2/haloperoxidase domain-containing protein n=1 Tax=Baudoinia panamericana (strain UAMH 10762) TaxID=717646 RepID=M2N061_BAUPA|nr:uncharacterized protein BAUCODRAFT_151731 [Baudoinia panamericana UAMH 10762]EMC92319.1 hypothetical protein BAUCODRAFT_151731 [Baudoinia panamericana UAMH 10762]